MGGARYARSSASSAASAPASVGTPGGGGRSNSTRGPRATSVSAGSRPRNENRPHRSACSTDSSRKADGSVSAAPASFTNAETGVSRSASTSRHTGTTVWSRASATNSSRDSPAAVTAAPGVTQTGPGVAPPPKARKKQLRSPVWQAPRPSCSTTNSSASTSQS